MSKSTIEWTAAQKIAATKVGCSIETYVRRLGEGQKWCYLCKEWHALDQFGNDRTRSDGKASACRASRNRAARGVYSGKRRPSPGRRFAAPRDGDKKQARARVNYLVAAGLLPRPDSLPCADCGQRWQSRSKRHEYDHYKGYGADHHEDVEVVCSKCHHLREKKRWAEQA